MPSKNISLSCLLCRKVVPVSAGGGHEQYEEHLRADHGVWSNRDWIVYQTLQKQEGENTRIKVKATSEFECDDIADLKVHSMELSMELEDSFSISTKPVLRRSTRKRPSSSISTQELKRQTCRNTNQVKIDIQEPKDVVIEMSANIADDNNFDNNSVLENVKELKRTIVSSSAMDLYSNVDEELDDAGHTVNSLFVDECSSKCGECEKIFKASYMQFHVVNTHAMTLAEYLDIHGDPESGKLRLYSVTHHLCCYCYEKMLLTRAEVEKHVVGVHQVSLKTYVREAMDRKGKDVNDNDVSSNTDVGSEEVALQENTAEYSGVEKVLRNVNSSISEDEEGDKTVFLSRDVEIPAVPVVSSDDTEEVESYSDDVDGSKADIDLISSESDASANENVVVAPQASTDKVYSDDYSDSCVVECSVCDKQMPIDSLRGHTASQHRLPISKYKEQFGSQLAFIKICYHLCKLCGKEVLLNKDSIAGHVRTRHKWSLKQYSDEYMRRKGVRNGDEKALLVDNEPISIAHVLPTSNEVIKPAEQDWCDANTFTCNICEFTSNVKDTFKKHVRSEHRASLSKFSDCYSSTDHWYKCHCCDKMVYHERNSIKAHVEGHLLSMKQYERLYERKRIRKLEREAEETMVSVSLENFKGQGDNHEENEDNYEKDPLEITITSSNEEFEGNKSSLSEHELTDPLASELSGPSSLNLSSGQAPQNTPVSGSSVVSQIISDIVDSLTTMIDNDQEEKDIKTVLSPEGGVMTPAASLSDIFLFLCPFPDCDFHIDSQGLDAGLAELHDGSVHHGEGVAWTKVTLEERMEQLFADA